MISKFHFCFFLVLINPLLNINRQRIERKRHIGNDVTVIVFVDSQEAFDPRSLISEFNRIHFGKKKSFQETNCHNLIDRCLFDCFTFTKFRITHVHKRKNSI